MKKINIYKLLFYILLIPYIIFAIYVFWPTKQEDKSQEPETIQSTCEKELEASSDPVEEFNGILKPVDFSDYQDAKIYYTRITESSKEGANFSGHYSLTVLGCGTDCTGVSVVNLKTGKVIAFDPVRENYHLQNVGSYFILEPVYAGQTREFYKIVDDKLELACTEIATKDMYGPIEQPI